MRRLAEPMGVRPAVQDTATSSNAIVAALNWWHLPAKDAKNVDLRSACRGRHACIATGVVLSGTILACPGLSSRTAAETL
jgi:hypothetical protein